MGLFAWLQDFRRLVVRYERYAANFLGMLHLGCYLITFLRASNAVNTFSGLFVGAVNGHVFKGNFNQVLAWNNGGQSWSGGQLGNGALTSTVPEPGNLTLFGTGLLGMAGFIRRKCRLA